MTAFRRISGTKYGVYKLWKPKIGHAIYVDSLHSKDMERGGISQPWIVSPLGNRTFASSPTGAILVPVLEREETTQSITIGVAMARATNTKLMIVRPVSIPRQRPLELACDEHAQHHEIVDDLVANISSEHPDISVQGVVRVGRSSERIISTAVTEHGIGAVVIEHTPTSERLSVIRRSLVERIAAHVPCDVIVTNGQGRVSSVSSILVPVTGGPHSRMAVDVGYALAKEFDAWIDVLHVIPEKAPTDRRNRGEQYVWAAIDRLGEAKRVNTWLVNSDNIVETIIEQTEYYDVTMLGAPQKGRLKRLVFGSTTDAISAMASNPVAMAKNSGQQPSGWRLSVLRS
jgi:nucleotide-binding universal stress UspA family protein